MPCRATQNGQVVVEWSHKMCQLEKYMANFVSILALRPQEQYEKKKVRTLKDELPKSVGAQYATEEECRNSSRRMKRLSQSENNAQLWM